MTPTPGLAWRIRNAAPIAAVIAFFILGFAADGWQWAWIVFLAVPLAYTLFPGERRRGVDLTKRGRSS